MTMDNNIVHKLIDELKTRICKELDDENLNRDEILRISQALDEIIKLLMNK